MEVRAEVAAFLKDHIALLATVLKDDIWVCILSISLAKLSTLIYDCKVKLHCFLCKRQSVLK